MHLPIRLVGFTSLDLSHVYGSSLVRLNWPSSHSANCIWRLELIWENGMAWTVQSIPTMTESGHEMGSLHIEESLAASLPTGFTRAELQLDTFVLAHIKIGTASESGITSECAVALLDTSEKELAIATAPATGAVAVLLPGQPWPATEFSPSGIIWAAI